MQGEDDLRGLAKIMAFMRAVSILLVLMHLYWFCYGFFMERGWTLEVINKILGNFGFKLFGNQRREEREDNLVKDLRGFGNWFFAVLSEYTTVKVVAHHWHILLYTDYRTRLYCFADGWGLDKQVIEKQPDG